MHKVGQRVRGEAGDAVLLVDGLGLLGQLFPGRRRGEAHLVVDGLVVEEDRAGGDGGQGVHAAIDEAHGLSLDGFGQGVVDLLHLGIFVDVLAHVHDQVILDVVRGGGGVVEDDARADAVGHGVVHRVFKPGVGLGLHDDFVLVLRLVESRGKAFQRGLLRVGKGMPDHDFDRLGGLGHGHAADHHDDRQQGRQHGTDFHGCPSCILPILSSNARLARLPTQRASSRYCNAGAGKSTPALLVFW